MRFKNTQHVRYAWVHKGRYSKPHITKPAQPHPRTGGNTFDQSISLGVGIETVNVAGSPSTTYSSVEHYLQIMPRPYAYATNMCKYPMFVWIVSAMTVTKVVEGCVYIRRRCYGILPRVGGEFEHSALSPLSLRSLSLALSSNTTTLNHLIRLLGSQGIQIWKQRTH